MEQINASLAEFKLAGISIRTNNKAEADPKTAKISSLVNEYFAGSIATKITNKKSPGKTFIVYTEYESNYTGEYTCFIGEETTEFNNLHANLKTIIIPAQQYIKFTTEAGSIPKIAIDSWIKIWQTPELEQERLYQADFEIYDERAIDPNNAILDIYVGVKK